MIYELKDDCTEINFKLDKIDSIKLSKYSYTEGFRITSLSYRVEIIVISYGREIYKRNLRTEEDFAHPAVKLFEDFIRAWKHEVKKQTQERSI